MIDLSKEGFVGARLSSGNLRGYFFYLTYSNRASIYNSKQAIENNFNYEDNALKSFYKYTSYRNNQSIKKDINAIELVLSYSRNANLILSLYKGVYNWEREQTKFVNNLLEEKLKDSVGFIVFRHEIDKTGYRLHFHVLNMPYNDSNEVIFGKKINKALRYLDRNILEEIKIEFRNFIKKELTHIDPEHFIIISEKVKNFKFSKITSINDILENKINYSINEDLLLLDKIKIEELIKLIKNKEIDNNIEEILYYSKYSKELLNSITSSYHIDFFISFLSKEDNILTMLIFDLLIYYFQENKINNEEILYYISIFRNNVKGELKYLIEDQLSFYFNGNSQYKKELLSLENNYNKIKSNKQLIQEILYNNSKELKNQSKIKKEGENHV